MKCYANGQVVSSCEMNWHIGGSDVGFYLLFWFNVRSEFFFSSYFNFTFSSLRSFQCFIQSGPVLCVIILVFPVSK